MMSQSCESSYGIVFAARFFLFKGHYAVFFSSVCKQHSELDPPLGHNIKKSS